MKEYKHDYNDLSVSMLKERDDYETILKAQPNEILPNIAKKTIISIIGSTNSGKSVFINSLVYKWYYDLFDYIVLISPSAKNDRSMWSFRNDPKCIIFEEYSDSIIEEIENIQKVESDEEYQDQPLMLMIFDDCANKNGCSKYDSRISQLATRHRHLGINLVFSIQVYKQLSHPIRNNTKAFIIKQNPNMNELLKMAEELAFCVGGKNNFLNLYHQVITKNKYGFLYLDVINQRAYDGFDTLLWSEETHGTAVFDVKRNNFDSKNKELTIEEKQEKQEEEKK
jgi:hypothetical protein